MTRDSVNRPSDRLKPNFFIVGAPKCGTTSLYLYLQRHPEVFLPARKEPHFWSTDLFRKNRISLQRYERLFQGASGKKRIGEASTEYLYSIDACHGIKSEYPYAKIIIMLRNPTDMIYSWHSQSIWRGRENVRDFEAALKLEDSRKRGEDLPQNPYPLEMLFYRDMGKYFKHVQRYIETFGEANVHVIIFERFFQELESSLSKLCLFLGIAYEPSISFEKENSNKRPRIGSVPLLLAYTPQLRRITARVPAPISVLVHNLVRAIVRRNTKYEARMPMREETRIQLDKFFEKDVFELSQLLKVDLSEIWFRRSHSRSASMVSARNREVVLGGDSNP